MGTLKFFPLQSSLHPGFWTVLAKTKLEVMKLEETPLNIWGSITLSDPPKSGLSPRLSVEWNAFEENFEHSWTQFGVRGQVVMKNTIEAFKSEDKNAFIQRAGEAMWASIQNGAFWRDPGGLASFAVLLFGDLKKYVFYYWFAFPAFNVPASVQLVSAVKLSEDVEDSLVQDIVQEFRGFVRENPLSLYSVLTIDEDRKVQFQKFENLPQICSQSGSRARVLICVVDPCSVGDYPGWPARNLVVGLAASAPHLLQKSEILCLRIFMKDGQAEAGHSIVLSLSCSGEPLTQMPTIVGWEKNERGQLAPRMVNLRSSMDPVKIAESSVDLNLKLMKWRLVPDLNLDRIKAARFLLLGSGTLGCGVARSLLGWGARHITFLDNSKVSYSNPVRQSLFEFIDCLDGGKAKAEVAAGKLSLIFPGVSSRGVQLSIPMPGHPISESLLAEVEKSFHDLEKLIIEHDVIFLLTDSRESRWLPTLLAACHPEKLVINAALGFDTFLVMRHGIRTRETSQSCQSSGGLVGGENLGCYFCNDVVAPGDSTRDRSLDMQCTVTRPGASAVAAALAVELAVSCLQHPLGPAAPAPAAAGSALLPHQDTVLESVLGIVPHSVRGSIFGFSQFLPTGPAFSQCTACSGPVIQLFQKEGFQLVKKVGEDPKYLEDMTGLTDLLNDTSLVDGVIGLDDDEFSVSSD